MESMQLKQQCMLAEGEGYQTLQEDYISPGFRWAMEDYKKAISKAGKPDWEFDADKKDQKPPVWKPFFTGMKYEEILDMDRVKNVTLRNEIKLGDD